MKSIFLIPALVTIALSGCARENVPPGRILIKNDFQDREYNILNVHGGGVSFSLKPGEKRLLPPSTDSFTLSRWYGKFTREYRVECPRGRSKGISIKMIDAHVNRMAGGCKTISSSKY